MTLNELYDLGYQHAINGEKWQGPPAGTEEWEFYTEGYWAGEDKLYGPCEGPVIPVRECKW